MQSWSRTTLTTLLALTVLTGSLAPPAYSHSHELGSESHDHDDPTGQADHHHDLAHHHGQGHHHHHHATNESRKAEKPTPISNNRHWHVSLFFVDFTLPTLPNSDDESGDNDQPLTNITRLVDFSRTNQVDVHSTSSLESSTTESTPAVSARLSMARRQPPPDHALLCDAARGERTGVLLI